MRYERRAILLQHLFSGKGCGSCDSRGCVCCGMSASPGSFATCIDGFTRKNKERRFMTREELKIRLEELLLSPAFEEGAEWTTVVIDPAGWEGFARDLRGAEGLDLDYLFCVTAIDWKTHFTMVYHLVST